MRLVPKDEQGENDEGAGQMARPSGDSFAVRRRWASDQHLPAVADTVSDAPPSAVKVTPTLREPEHPME